MERKSCYYELGIRVSIKSKADLSNVIRSIPSAICILGIRGRIPSKTLSKDRDIEITLAVLSLEDLKYIGDFLITNFRIRGILDPDWILSLHSISESMRCKL